MVDNNNLGIGIKLLMPSQTEINNIIQLINSKLDGKIKTNVNLIVDTTKVNQSAKQIKDILDKNLKIPINLNVELSKIQLENLKKQVENIKSKINITTSGNIPLEIKKIQDQFNILKNIGGTIDFSKSKLLPDLDMTSSKITTLSNGIKNITQEYKLNDNQILKVNGSYNTLSNTLENISTSTENLKNKNISLIDIFKKFGTWLLVGNLFMGFYHQIRNAIQFVRDMDSAMVDLQKVTNETAQTYKAFGEEATQLGMKLARTTVDVVKATTNFARMGYQLSEAKELAKTAIITGNVGDIEDINKATEYLISTIKGYNIAAEDSIRITDIMNEVSNKHSITVAGLGEAYKRSAAILSQGGNSIEQATALITAANSAIQNPERVGNGLKSVAMRIRGIDEESGETFPKLEGLLRSVGVEVRKTDDSFRSTYDILKDLSVVWNQLDDFTKANLTEQMAGKYQANVMTSLLTNFAEAEKTLADALNSVGSAAQENETYLNSVEARMTRFQVSLEEMYKNMFSSDLLKGFVDVLDLTVTGLSKLTNFFGAIPTAIGLATTSILTFNTNLRTTVATTTQNILAAGTLKARIDALRVSLNGAATAAKTFAASTIVGLGLTVVTAGIFKLLEAIGKYNRQQKELFETTSENVNKINIELTKVNNLVTSYEELTNKVSLNKQEKQKLLEIQREIAEVLPQTTNRYDEEGRAIADNIELIKEVIALKEEERRVNQELLRLKFVAESPKDYEDLLNKTKERDRLLQKQKELTDKITQQTEAKKLYPNIAEGIQQNIERLYGEYSKLQVKLDDVNADIGQLTQNIVESGAAFLNSSDSMNKFGNIFNQKIVKGVLEFGKTKDFINSFTESLIDTDFGKILKEYNEQISKLGTDQQKEKVELFKNTLPLLQAELAKTGLVAEEAAKLLDKVLDKPAEENVVKKVEDLASLKGQLLDTFKDISKEISDYNQVLYKLAEGKKINLEEIQNLLAEYPSLISAINMENNQMVISAEKLGLLRDARVQETQATISSQVAKTNIVSNETINRLRSYGLEIQGLQNLMNAHDRFVAIQTIKSKIVDRASGAVANQMIDEINKFGDLADFANKLTSMVSSSNFGLNLNDTSGTKEKVDPVKELVDQYKDSLRQLDIQIELSKAKQELLTKSSEQYRDELQKQIAILKQKQDVVHQEAEALRAMGLDDSNEHIIEAQVNWNKFQKAINDMESETQLSRIKELFEQIDKSIKPLENSVKRVKDEISLLDDSQVEEKFQLLDDLTFAYDQYIQKIRDSITELQKESQALNENSDAYKQNQEKIQSLQETLANVIIDREHDLRSQLQKLANDVIAIYKEMYRKQKEAAVKAIDDQMEAEEKRHKKVNDNLDEELDKYEELINAKLKLIDQESDEEDYTKNLNKLQTERQEILNQINVLSLDDSYEARTKLSELNKELTKKDEDIEELKSKRSKELRKDNLKDQLDAYKKDIETKKKNEDNKYEAEKERLDDIKEVTEKYWDDMIGNERKYLEIRNQILDGHFDQVESDFASFGKFLEGNIQSIGNNISVSLIDKMKAVVAEAKKVQAEIANVRDVADSIGVSVGSTGNNYASIIAQMKANSAAWSNASEAEKQRLHNENISLGKSLPGAYYDSAVGKWYDPTGKDLYSSSYYSSNKSSSGGSSSDKSDDSGGSKTKLYTNKTSAGWKIYGDPTYSALVYATEEMAKNYIKSQVEKYPKKYTMHQGGIVGDGIPPYVVKLMNKLFNTKGNETLIKALKNEIFVPPQNIVNNFIPNARNLVNSAVSEIPKQPMVVREVIERDMHVHINKVVADDKKSVDRLLERIHRESEKRGK